MNEVERLKEDIREARAEQVKERESQPQKVGSTSDERVVNNVMRHEYRVLSESEKAQMKAIKDAGLQFSQMLDSIGSSREISLAKTRIEEAVMWGVNHVTR